MNHSHFYNEDDCQYCYWYGGQTNIKRSIFMGDYIYAISSGGITVTNLTSMENSDEVEFSDYIEKQENINQHNYHLYDSCDENYNLFLRHDKRHGAYSSFEGSPLSKGKFQFDLWNVKPSSRYDWESLRNSIQEYGVRNSLCVAPMPTASTSQILSNNECFEPFTSNMYSRRTLAGEFVVINLSLIHI